MNLAADALNDDLLGFHLAEEFELRLVDLLYFVIATSATLGEALNQMARYNSIANESLLLSWEQERALKVRFNYAGVARHSDRHQIEFWITALMRIFKHLTASDLKPIRISVTHPRCAASAQIEEYLGCAINFAAGTDEITFARGAGQLPLKDAEPYLNRVLVRHCEDALARRVRPSSPLQASVENAIAPLLPEGKVRVSGIAQALGMSRRTLARRLADENLTFSDILDGMRADLAQHYLKDPNFSISEIASATRLSGGRRFHNSLQAVVWSHPTRMRNQIGSDSSEEGRLSSRVQPLS